jgi:hypothetical protein
VDRLKRHLSVANVLSVTALFVALGGSAYAAAKLGPGQVKAVNIANQAVTNPKIKTQAVTSGKIKNLGINAADIGTGSVINSKVAKKAITNSKLASNAVGASKVKSGAITEAKLGKEAVGTTKIKYESINASKISASLYDQLVRNVSYVNAETANNSEDAKTVTAFCPSGKEAIGGGARVNGELKQVAVTGSNPYATGSSRTGWSAYARESEETASSWSLTAFVVCAEL